MHGLISKSSFVDWQDQPDFNHLWTSPEVKRLIFLAEAGWAVLRRPPRLCQYYWQLASRRPWTKSSGRQLRCGSNSAGMLQPGRSIPATVICMRYRRYRYNNSLVTFNLRARNPSVSSSNCGGSVPERGRRHRLVGFDLALVGFDLTPPLPMSPQWRRRQGSPLAAHDTGSMRRPWRIGEDPLPMAEVV